jgi:hypothetical protein
MQHISSNIAQPSILYQISFGQWCASILRDFSLNIWIWTDNIVSQTLFQYDIHKIS